MPGTCWSPSVALYVGYFYGGKSVTKAHSALNVALDALKYFADYEISGLSRLGLDIGYFANCVYVECADKDSLKDRYLCLDGTGVLVRFAAFSTLSHY